MYIDAHGAEPMACRTDHPSSRNSQFGARPCPLPCPPPFRGLDLKQCILLEACTRTEASLFAQATPQVKRVLPELPDVFTHLAVKKACCIGPGGGPGDIIPCIQHDDS